MQRSLVGSEMCIRDRVKAKLPDGVPFPAGFVVSDSANTADEVLPKEARSDEPLAETAAVADGVGDPKTVADVAPSAVADDNAAENKKE